MRTKVLTYKHSSGALSSKLSRSENVPNEQPHDRVTTTRARRRMYPPSTWPCSVVLAAMHKMWPGQQCADTGCAARVKRLQRFFQFYKAVVETYVESSKTTRVLKTHEDLYNAIQALKSKPEMTRTEFSNTFGPGKHNSSDDIAAATTLAVQVLIMIDCSALHRSSDRLESGYPRVHWKDDVAFSKYLGDLFPQRSHPVLSSAENDLFVDVKAALRATELKKHLHITLQATHDVRSHLRFDRKNNIVEIFHHTAFLKEQLKLTRGGEDSSDPSTSIRVGSLPRQLVLEVLDSIQGVLFPLSDLKSRNLLQSLVDNCAFDPDATVYEYASIRQDGEDNIPFVFLADRISDLYNEMQNPRPRGWLERQLQRKSGARYMLMATLIGVIFAVFLGMLSLVVSSYQTWIAYQAWQHPVLPPTVGS